MNNFKPIIGYTPGVIGRIAELHAKFYTANWNFGQFFEAMVATELSKFVNDYNKAKDRIWSLPVNGKIEGSITIDGTSETNNSAHLRWFIVSDRLKGKGAGHYLMDQALAFCQKAGYEKVYLWTFQGLAPARHLYEKFGFALVDEHPGKQWGTTVTEQRFDLNL